MPYNIIKRSETMRKYDFMESPDYEGYSTEEMPISKENEFHHYLNAVIHDYITEEGNTYFSTHRGRGNKSEREDKHSKHCKGCEEYREELKKIENKGV
jgi:hypothetical protein